MANPPVNSTTPPKTSGVNGGIRIVLALLVGIALGIFMLTWDANFIPHQAIPDWVGPYIVMPLIAIVLGFGSNSLIQQLSCGQVQWWVQLQRVAIAPIPIILLWFFLGIAPGMRWPIEGLVQSGSPALRKGLSSGFYAFWMGLYFQNMLNGAAQLCPV
jgi:Na+/H+-dicarboxylate symporter